jgi:hypothetical protein
VCKSSQGPRENVFYANLDASNPGQIARHVRSELSYIDHYLKICIDRMNNEQYGVEWELDESKRYELFPQQKVFIKKPMTQIIIQDSNLDPKVALLDQDYHPIQQQGSPQTIESLGTIITLQNAPKKALVIRYKDTTLEWSRLIHKFEKGQELKIESGHSFIIKQIQEHSTEIQVKLNNNLRENETLVYQGYQIQYRLETQQTNTLTNNDQQINFQIISENPLIIETNEPINQIRNEQNAKIAFRELKRRKEIWINLVEPTNHDSSTENTISKLDIFYDFLASGYNMEIWETPDGKGRIRVIRTNREENKLLLDRIPSHTEIFPPVSDYQLRRQRDAVQTLMYRPTIEHRNLLKLFEPYSETRWESKNNTFTSRNTAWEYLSDESREGTSEQRAFVLKALNTNDYAILEGPPGSGKTTAITELIYQLLKDNKRVLLSASTHVAVDNVLEILREKRNDPDNTVHISPLRIGREESISSDINEFQIDQKKKVIQDKLGTEEWYSDSPERSKTDIVNNSIMWSSNLVCGTIIGILQYPNFRESRGDFVFPEFDYLIIDEASKTTFHEFLVPAIYAKKWVLVGDVKQLSPYTDTHQVQANLERIIDDARGAAYVIFINSIYSRLRSGERRSDPPIVIVHETHIIESLFRIIIEKNNEKIHPIQYAYFTDEFTNNYTKNISFLGRFPNKYALLQYDVIIMDKPTFDNDIEIVPETHTIIDFTSSEHQGPHDYRTQFWLNKNQYKYRDETLDPILNREKIIENCEKSWAGEVAWRLNRVNELGLDDESENATSYYWTSMKELLPSKHDEKIWEQIEKIERICYPSILTSLQEGVSKGKSRGSNRTIFSTGFLPDQLKTKYQALSYQHRMHDEISALPRKIFYNEKALKDISKITNSSYRSWSYPRYPSRLIWIDTSTGMICKNHNPAEIKKIKQEIIEFQTWARSQKKQYSILVISFYEKQRRALRDMLRVLCQAPRKQTRFSLDNLSIGCYTVDRVQGREADLVFLSMVRNKGIGFMDNSNRLNVSLTRARFQQIIVGDYDHFTSRGVPSLLRKIANSVTKW